MDIVQKIESIGDIQDAIKQALDKNVYFAKSKIEVITENSAKIEYMIKNAIGKLGICCVVQTPRLDFYGKADDGHPVWQLSEITIVVSEIPTVNRGRAGSSTALDAALQAAESLNELGSALCLQSINQIENQGVVSVFVTFKTAIQFMYFRNDLNSNQR